MDLSIDETPVLYHFASILSIGIRVAIITPLSLLRKRLHIQRISDDLDIESNESSTPFIPGVRVSPVHYTGMYHALTDIVANEGMPRRRRRIKKRPRPSVRPNISGSEAGDPLFYQPFSTPSVDNESGGGSVEASSVASSGNKGAGRYWVGVKSLYRGYWPEVSVLVLKHLISLDQQFHE
jgi:hypothetical protein